MKRSTQYPIGLLLFLCANIAVAGGSLSAEVDQIVERYRSRGLLDGVSVAITEGESVRHLRGYGSCGGQPVAADTGLLLGSASKPLTAFRALQMLQTGRLALDAPVASYLPDSRGQPVGTMTIRQLLTHTSGYTRKQGHAIPDLVGGALYALAPGKPGAFAYSNFNYVVLGLVLEAVEGSPFAEQMQRHIFEPLAMSATSADAAASASLCSKRMWFGLPFETTEQVARKALVPAGFIRSTAQDMARWLIAVEAGPDAHPAVPTDIDALMGESRYGFGWSYGSYAGEPIAWHNGSTATYASSVVRLPKRDVGIVVLANTPPGLLQNPVDALARDLIERVVTGDAQPAAGWPWERALLFTVLGALLLSAFRTLRLALQPRSRRAPTKRWQRAVVTLAAVGLLTAFTIGWPLPAGSLWALRPDLLLALLAGCALSLMRQWLRPLLRARTARAE